MGSVAADGWVSLAGRSDDVINRGGEKVYPSEVEDVLLGDPRVLEAVVVGRPDDVLGAVPVAYVIVEQDAADEADAAEAADEASAVAAAAAPVDAAGLVADLTARAEAHLTRFRRPVEIIVVPDLPRAPTGKVQRAKVRTMAQPS
ncbi:acyl--CoA ligase [Curtobacterium sp. 24E2]|nr:acyl--CoA ligase [Curtobacterium sp. 24E2]